MTKKAIVDIRLRPSAAIRRTQRKIMNKIYCDMRRCVLYAPLCENMTSSTKPEVHNVMHCGQRTTKRRQHVTCRPTEHFVTCGHAICERTDRQTDRQTR